MYAIVMSVKVLIIYKELWFIAAIHINCKHEVPLKPLTEKSTNKLLYETLTYEINA